MADNSNKMTWMLAILVLFLGCISVANFFLLLQTRSEQDEDAAEEARYEEPKPPLFVTIGPMTVNLQRGSSGQRLLYIGVNLQAGDEQSLQILELHKPDIHSRLLVMLSTKTADSLMAPGSKEMLAEEIMEMLGTPLAENLPPLNLHSVLFTDFIVQ